MRKREEKGGFKYKSGKTEITSETNDRASLGLAYAHIFYKIIGAGAICKSILELISFIVDT